MIKHRLDYVEIYITNVCNYSCTHCQSLNNFSFKGHQLWNDYKDQYQTISNRIDFNRIQIMGGEPTLNPDFDKWVSGISTLWPGAKLEIATNGTKLNKLDHSLYQTLSKNKSTLWFTCHDINLYNDILEFSQQFLDEIIVDNKQDDDAWKNTYNLIKEESWPACDTIEQFVLLPEDIKIKFNEAHRLGRKLDTHTHSRVLIDKNGVEVKIDWSQTFISSSMTTIGQTIKLQYNNDPIEAHDSCYFRTCHQLNKGKLYKCPLVSVLPDFLRQFSVDIAEHDLLLANSYRPVTSSDTDIDISNFIKNIDQPISQCKFCPSKHDPHNFVGTDKKIKFVPRTAG